MRVELVHDLPAGEYHGDPCDVPSLSASIAKRLIHDTPYHAWLYHPKLGRHRGPRKDAFDWGNLVEALLLTPDAAHEAVGIVDAKDYRTKAAQSERDAHIAAGRTPVLAADYGHAHNLVRQVRSLLAAEGVAFDGASQVSAFWGESGVQCRARYDHLHAPIDVLTDLKTTRSVARKSVERDIIEYGYDIQAAAYLRSYKAVTGRDAKWRWVFVEDGPQRPFVAVVEPSADLLRVGEIKWLDAVTLWAACLETDDWPAYPTRFVAEPPAWALAQVNNPIVF